MVVQVQQCNKSEDLAIALLTAILLYYTWFSTEIRCQNMEEKFGEQIMVDLLPKAKSRKHFHFLWYWHLWSIFLKVRHSKMKRYEALFICEPASSPYWSCDHNRNRFIYSKMIARRVNSRSRSDNCTNFAGTEIKLKKHFKRWITLKSSTFCRKMEQIG